MKIKLVVITVDEKRRKYIEKQLEDLGIVKNFDIDYFEGFTPSNSKEYINYKDKNKPESDETLCCFRSYFAIFNFNKYSKSDSEDNYDYIITIEDDISIILSDFKDKIDNVINLWKNHPEIEYISLGYLLSFDISEIKNLGINLELCGHTHDGQIWPFNLAPHAPPNCCIDTHVFKSMLFYLYYVNTV